MSIDFSPPVNRDMQVLDRDFFKKDIGVMVARFPEPKYLGQFVKACKDDILLHPGIKHIVPVANTRGVLLNCRTEGELSDSVKKLASEYGIVLEPYTLHLDYSFWKADEILQAVLPEVYHNDVPSGFAQAGHVAHLNLRKEFKIYGLLIGQVIMDKNLKVETVVDKAESIDTKFRTFKMNILAGKDDFVVEQSESGCKFKFDFSKVYWNSRLGTEHERLISVFQPGEVVADVFAGVGPFAVPAGKNQLLVLANDLNPESFKYLRENVISNGVADFVKSSCLDGREFIRQSPRMLLDWARSEKAVEKKKTMKRRKVDPETKKVVHSRNVEVVKVEIPVRIANYVMNLPDLALTFLDEFVSLYSRDLEVEEAVKDIPDLALPFINVHCFEKYQPDEEEPAMEELHKRVHTKICKYLDFAIPFQDMKFHLVRKVAPTKPMFCVTFQLPREVAFRKTT